MFSDDEEEIDNEFVDNLLSRINSGCAGYIDVNDIKDSYFFLVDEGRRDDAVAMLNWALGKQPDNTTLLFTKFTQLVDNEEFEKAQELLEYLRERAHDTSTFQYDQAVLLLRRGEISPAMEWFEMSFSNTQGDELRYTIMDAVTELTRAQYYEESQKFYARLSHDDIFQDLELAFGYAYALDKTGRDEEALRAYEEVVKIDPFCSNAWNNLGIEYGKFERFEESLTAYTNATDAAPYNANPYFNKGNTYKALDNFYEAIENYTEYVSLVVMGSDDGVAEGFDSSVFLHIGECWYSLGNYDIAKRFLRLAVTTFVPQADTGWYNLGRCLTEMGEYSEAQEALGTAIALNRECADYYYANAQVFLQQGILPESIEMLEAGLSKSPNDVLAWFELIRVKLLSMESGSTYSIKDYIAKMKRRYKTPMALRLVDAYIDYFVYGRKRYAADKVRMVAGDTPSVINEAMVEPTLSKLFMQQDITPILREFNIRLR